MILKPRSKLIKLRKERGYTQQDMANKLKITRAAYANYETGYRNPNLDKSIKIKQILETTTDEIFLRDSDTISV